MVTRDVLIFDSDESFLTAAIDALEEFGDSFNVLVATGADEARAELAKTPVSVVVVGATGVGGPGSELVDHLGETYPEIPFIMVAGDNIEDVQAFAKNKGAIAFLEKPLEFSELARRLGSAIKKEADAGTLRGVSPGMFLQMIEMEERSCVIRMENDADDILGVLFFREGELLDARVHDLTGAEAAYVIFSWDEVSLSIQNGCPPRESRIHQNAQGLLLEAMRRKDETGKEKKPEPEAGEPADLGAYDTSLSDADLVAGADGSLGGYEELTDEDLEAPTPISMADLEAEDENNGPLTPEEVEKRLEDEIGPRCGLEDVVHDSSMNTMISQSEKVARLFDAGALKIAYLDYDNGPDRVVLPGENTTVARLKPRCPKNEILQVLTR